MLADHWILSSQGSNLSQSDPCVELYRNFIDLFTIMDVCHILWKFSSFIWIFVEFHWNLFSLDNLFWNCVEFWIQKFIFIWDIYGTGIKIFAEFCGNFSSLCHPFQCGIYGNSSFLTYLYRFVAFFWWQTSFDHSWKLHKSLPYKNY